MPPPSDSDYGALLGSDAAKAEKILQLEAENRQLREEQEQRIERVEGKTSTPKLVLIITALTGLASAPFFVELAKPDPPPAASKQDVDALRREISSLRSYLREKHHADEQRWRVTTSALDRIGFRVRGMSGDGVRWTSKNARAEEFEAKDDLGRDMTASDYPLPPE